MILDILTGALVVECMLYVLLLIRKEQREHLEHKKADSSYLTTQVPPSEWTEHVE